MKRIGLFSLLVATTMSCVNNTTDQTKEKENQQEAKKESMNKEETSDFQWQTEQFADLRILRYRIPGWEDLSLQQKKYVYHLTQAGLAGRDIIYDQNYRHNLEIRKALENIVKNYEGKKDSASQWDEFMTYTKRVWFSNGIHHHYSNVKFKPEFDKAYFDKLLKETQTELSEEAKAVMFNDEDMKKVSKDSDKDLVLASAVNFYDPDITEEEAINFYKQKMNPEDKTPVSHGLNSKLVRKEDGSLAERKWTADGMYGPAIKKIIANLKKAREVAENQKQKDALDLLIKYYQTGDLETFDKYNIAWVNATEGDVDYINSFIEVYDDPLGYKATYETIVEIKDFEASQKMGVISDNIQYFEDNSPIMDEYKKEDVKGVTYKMVNVAGEAGATTPATPIGVNLPNSSWIRSQHGSKSVSLANIEHAYDKAKGGGFLEEFTFTTQELERAKEYGATASKMHTALHEVVGHASGKLAPGVGTTKETLKNYASTLEEARADLVGLYYIMDPKLKELGLVDTMEVAKAGYDSYIRNGLMLQLRRLDMGANIEEDHMRNRQLVALWAYEMGEEDNVIEKKEVDGKTYFVINDYKALRDIFGKQLREIQRIKSEGDYEAGKKLVEQYGVQVNPDIHREVLKRTEKLNIAPYSGFIQPRLEPVMGDDSTITDVKVRYPKDFTEQMMRYAEEYSNL